MATERTAMTPDGDVVFLEVSDEQYMTPEGNVIDGGLDAAGGAGVVQSIAGPGGIAGHGGIAGKHGGIAG
jgi:hypothetical protein